MTYEAEIRIESTLRVVVEADSREDAESKIREGDYQEVIPVWLRGEVEPEILSIEEVESNG